MKKALAATSYDVASVYWYPHGDTQTVQAFDGLDICTRPVKRYRRL
ncbi:hypothetical protein [Rhizobium gallicum]|nr:hypothetical protein [Rhizobium gallicum]